MINNEQEAQQIVIRHIGGLAWPTLFLLTGCVMMYLSCVWILLSGLLGPGVSNGASLFLRLSGLASCCGRTLVQSS